MSGSKKTTQLNTAISYADGDYIAISKNLGASYESQKLPKSILDLVYLLASALGQANGVASLDSGGKVPLAQISDAVLGQVEYKGTWNASTNSPTLPTTPAKKGDYYVVSTAGTRFGLSFAVGDWCISNGTTWEKVDNTEAVTTVFGRLGNIIAQQGDYSSFYILLTSKGQANGVATLDSGTKIPIAQIPDAVLGQVEYKGTWKASTNSPTLPTTPAKKGDYYVVSTAGTRFGSSFAVGDWCISNGTAWEKVDNTDAVMTVFGRLGNVVALESDYQAFYSLLGHVHTIAEQTKGSTELVVSAGATTLNCANNITAVLNVSAALTLNISNMRDGMYMDIRILVTGKQTITLGTLHNISSQSPTRIGINGSLSNLLAGHYHIGFSYIDRGSVRYLDINIAQY